jgi:hypothetical protein
MFDTVIKHDLHADTYTQHRSATSQPATDQLATLDCAQPIHHGRKRADTWDNQTISSQHRVAVCGNSHDRTCAL